MIEKNGEPQTWKEVERNHKEPMLRQLKFHIPNECIYNRAL